MAIFGFRGGGGSGSRGVVVFFSSGILEWHFAKAVELHALWAERQTLAKQALN